MRGYLSFNLPEERDDFDTCQNGWKYRAVVEEIFNFLRQKYKYEDKKTVSIDVLREKIVEIKQSYDLYD